ALSRRAGIAHGISHILPGENLPVVGGLIQGVDPFALAHTVEQNLTTSPFGRKGISAGIVFPGGPKIGALEEGAGAEAAAGFRPRTRSEAEARLAKLDAAIGKVHETIMAREAPTTKGARTIQAGRNIAGAKRGGAFKQKTITQQLSDHASNILSNFIEKNPE